MVNLKGKYFHIVSMPEVLRRCTAQFIVSIISCTLKIKKRKEKRSINSPHYIHAVGSGFSFFHNVCHPSVFLVNVFILHVSGNSVLNFVL